MLLQTTQPATLSFPCFQLQLSHAPRGLQISPGDNPRDYAQH
jgi:hypothetical protein